MEREIKNAVEYAKKNYGDAIELKMCYEFDGRLYVFFSDDDGIDEPIVVLKNGKVLFSMEIPDNDAIDSINKGKRIDI